jgi:endonuclease/exonuclease/phosphatase family metal-dependent hydrolase
VIVFVAFVSLLIVTGLPASSSSAAPDAPPRPLRFVTFNLYHGGPFSGLSGDDRHLERRLELAIEELKALRPDVIGLQEASTSRRRGSVAGRLAGGLGFFYVYAPTNPRPFGGEWVQRALAALLNFSEGPAIVSRLPIRDWRLHRLPRCAGPPGESRALLSATLDTPWGVVEVSSAHTRGDPCQTTAVANLVSRGPHPLPGVLMGDFNAVEGSPALAPFRESAGFVDAFRAANPTEPGPTVWQRLDAPESTVSRRADYIFLLPGEHARGRVLSSRVVLNRPRRLEEGVSLWPSDHYGVLAEVEIVSASDLRVATPFLRTSR